MIVKTESPTDALAALREKHVKLEDPLTPGREGIFCKCCRQTWPCDTQKALALVAQVVEERDERILRLTEDRNAFRDVVVDRNERQESAEARTDSLQDRLAILQAEHARLDAENRRFYADNETLRSFMHGMQDGAALRDALATNEKLRAEKQACQNGECGGSWKQINELENENATLRAERDETLNKWIAACDKAHDYERECAKLRAETAGLVRAARDMPHYSRGGIEHDNGDALGLIAGTEIPDTCPMCEALAPFPSESGE